LSDGLSSYDSKINRSIATDYLRLSKVQDNMTTTFNTWIKYPKPNPQARLRLFCFPYAGGGALVFRTWPQALPDEVEVCSIQLPGREDRLREPPLSHIPKIVQHLEQALLPALDRPFAFFGHSLGAVIGFELARRLRPRYRPVHLFVAGRHAPQLPDLRPHIHQLPDADFLRTLQQRYQGIPREVLQHAELVELLLPVLRADLTAVETYTYTDGEPLGCPISAFGGLQDRNASRAQLAAWGEQTRHSFSLEMFPGDHFFLNNAPVPLLRAISKHLNTYLAERGTV
jgi:medium-chain acyl-[acyl-carrier-protein] hydrolase